MKGVKGREREIYSDIYRENISLLLVYSPDDYNSQGWTKPIARILTQVSHVDGRAFPKSPAKRWREIE